MKNIVKLFDIIALVAVIGFSMAACGDEGNGGGTIDGSTISSGTQVNYPEKTPAEAKSQTDFSYIINKEGGVNVVYPLSNFINPNEPASVKITNSKLDIKLGTPKSEHLFSIGNNSEDWVGVTITPFDAKVFMVDDESGFFTSNGNYQLYCIQNELNSASLIYADKAVTIKTVNEYNKTVIFDVSLQKGWNYLIETRVGITSKFTSSETLPGGFKWTVGSKKPL